MMKIGINHATAPGRIRTLPPAPAKPEAQRFGFDPCCLRPTASRPLNGLKKSREATLECSQTRQCLVVVGCATRPSGTADLPLHSLGHHRQLRPFVFGPPESAGQIQPSPTQSNHARGGDSLSPQHPRAPSRPDLPPAALDRGCGKAQPQHSLPAMRLHITDNSRHSSSARPNQQDKSNPVKPPMYQAPASASVPESPYRRPAIAYQHARKSYFEYRKYPKSNRVQVSQTKSNHA